MLLLQVNAKTWYYSNRNKMAFGISMKIRFLALILLSASALLSGMQQSQFDELGFAKNLVDLLTPQQKAALSFYHPYSSPPRLIFLMNFAKGNKEVQDRIREYFERNNNFQSIDDHAFILFEQTSPEYLYFSVFFDGKKIGYAELRDRSSSSGFKAAYLYNVFINEEFRNKNYGAQLMRFIIKKMKDLSYKMIYLKVIPIDSAGDEIRDPNLIEKLLPRLFKFYEQFGFKKTDFQSGREMQLILDESFLKSYFKQ